MNLERGDEPRQNEPTFHPYKQSGGLDTCEACHQFTTGVYGDFDNGTEVIPDAFLCNTCHDDGAY